MNIRKNPFFIFLIAASVPGAVHGQSEIGSEIVSEITACRDIVEDAARLACFDGAASRLATAAEANDIVVLSREDVRQTRREMFGLAEPRIRAFEEMEATGEEDEGPISRISSTVIQVGRVGRNLYQVTLEDGGVWETTERTRGNISPRIGDVIEIRRAALGSFLANIGGRRAVRIRRTR